MLRLLCITAHPDDEAASFGGTLLQCRRRGVETNVICLTAGHAATHRGGAASDQELARMRREEFAASCKILEVSRGEVWNYPDAGLDRQPLMEISGALSRCIREIRPQVVITFGPEGGLTAHPDHTMASMFATAAFHWAGRNNRFPEQLQAGLKTLQAQKLYYATASFTLSGRQPISLAPRTVCVDIRKSLETKIRAFHAHTSQSPLFPIFEDAVQRYGGQELFHLAACSRPQETRQEADLFEGIEAD